MPRLKDLLSQRKLAAEKASSSGGAANAENKSEVQLRGLEAPVVLPLASSAPDIGPACSEQDELLAAGISGVASLEVRKDFLRETSWPVMSSGTCRKLEIH